MNTEDRIIEAAKKIKAARVAVEKFSKISQDFNTTQKRRHSANEDARMAAIELRHWRHELHCLAVEAGVADMRAPEHYADSEAPAGFGRSMVFHRRAPRGVDNVTG